MGPGPLPRSLVMTYVASDMDYLTGDAADQMVDTLRSIDQGWLSFYSEKPETAQRAADDPDKETEHPVRGLLRKVASRAKTTQKKT